MPRVKRGTQAIKRRRNILKQTKGFMWGRKSKERQAREALLKAWTYSYRDRRTRKRDLRRLWQVKINAGARENGTTYSRLMDAFNKQKIVLNRKTLAELAQDKPETFKRVVEKVNPTSAKESTPSES
ncbi:MAG: 50S ribosomal protein L20 [Candidatus Colwellbacteria bacterium CG10_big_fil_rev_8_21_14_0_10_42_22]|uniref:Large ribosomal subunit protein bL20 n=1 Tax=Candidatus Colwellbacteria bacterium CG10_big_fil_rev_8_21_14_0_10_42_22 TaxID=1974540 RepID=A0A2H0VI04_9BACT|nr:MAG: 50S ribosomal protein L20 [Candidatus Colwellbacteria bacterium CG10_big_fil_rev_8_21_14_0_10_42_22]